MFQVYFGHFTCLGAFGHNLGFRGFYRSFFLGFGVVLVIFFKGFWGISITFLGFRVFWYFFQVSGVFKFFFIFFIFFLYRFQRYFGHFLGLWSILVICQVRVNFGNCQVLGVFQSFFQVFGVFWSLFQVLGLFQSFFRS